MWLIVGGAHVGGRGYEGGCGYKDRRDHLSRMGPRVGVAVMGGAMGVALAYACICPSKALFAFPPSFLLQR